MNKSELEVQLQDAFNNGFWPKEIVRYEGSSPLRVISDENEPDRIIIATRTTEDSGRQHTQRLVYDLKEAQKLLEEYRA